jgi:hypothetical protein
MTRFVGRETELDELMQYLEVVRKGRRAGDRGAAVALRGRRRVGKSSLVTELVRRAELPHVFFQAARGASPGDQLAALADAIATSTLPNAALADGAGPSSLTAALRLLAAALPADGPAIVVLDELPWLLESIPSGAGELQRVWDQDLSHRPMLLVLLGSDLSMMERLDAYDEPFHGRARPMVLHELSPRDVARVTGLSGAAAFDAYLITGGQPLIAVEWEHGERRASFIERSLQRSTSAMIVQGARILDSEFPPDTHPRAVLTAIGGRGERTHTGILRRLDGAMSAATLDRALGVLAEKRVLAADEPLSARAGSKDRRWRVSDPALRFWLAAVEPVLAEVDRGRPDLAMRRVDETYTSWRGRAIEPVVRDALARLLPDDRWSDVMTVGGWWPRTNNPEVDLIGADQRPAKRIGLVGTIKWRAERPLDHHDIDALARDAVEVPGVDIGTPLVGVCPAGATDSRLAQVWTADDLLTAWR